MSEETPLLNKAQYLYKTGIEKKNVDSFESSEPITSDEEIDKIKKELVELRKLWESYTKTYEEFINEFGANENPVVFEKNFGYELEKFIDTFLVLKFQIEAKIHELNYKKRVLFD